MPSTPEIPLHSTDDSRVAGYATQLFHIALGWRDVVFNLLVLFAWTTKQMRAAAAGVTYISSVSSCQFPLHRPASYPPVSYLRLVLKIRHSQTPSKPVYIQPTKSTNTPLSLQNLHPPTQQPPLLITPALPLPNSPTSKCVGWGVWGVPVWVEG
ncbi:hypothetical protein K440DRAFT_372615 [Wilcoxina mikolae CBS 423.85]|nr:hypothetical protein K440DRAFT_372615 [Wilcoxina mikolae CBS 423.85]